MTAFNHDPRKSKNFDKPSGLQLWTYVGLPEMFPVLSIFDGSFPSESAHFRPVSFYQPRMPSDCIEITTVIC